VTCESRLADPSRTTLADVVLVVTVGRLPGDVGCKGNEARGNPAPLVEDAVAVAIVRSTSSIKATAAVSLA
jgi:hypothetical protein